MPRFHVPFALAPGLGLALPPGAARHAQVLRLQPGDAITLFNGDGGEWSAAITRMGRGGSVEAEVQAHLPVEREAARAVHLAVGLMAADRMDWLVEKATELGARSLTPLQMARSSLRLAGERAAKKRVHWQGVSAAACEQSGRNRLMQVCEQLTFQEQMATATPAAGAGDATAARWMLTLEPGAPSLAEVLAAWPAGAPLTVLSGPEGGFSPEEAAAARAAGWQPVSLGARVLRAETAPLAVLAAALLAPLPSA